MFKVNNKVNRTTSVFLALNIYFTSFSDVSIVDFEQVSLYWVAIFKTRKIISIKFK